MMSLLVSNPMSTVNRHWKSYVPGIPGNMFIFNLAGHEVRQNTYT